MHMAFNYQIYQNYPYFIPEFLEMPQSLKKEMIKKWVAGNHPTGQQVVWLPPLGHGVARQPHSN